LAHSAVCVLKELIIPSVSVDQVLDVCHRVFKEMGLKIMKDSTREGRTTVLAGESALLPLTLRALLYPFSLAEYLKMAQRSGVHVVASQEKDGVHLRTCGVALDEISGKPEKYTKDEIMEEANSMLEAMDFEQKFIKKIKDEFPGITEAT
jgi:hypothetical protein